MKRNHEKQSEAEDTAAYQLGNTKRKAVAPGYLRDILQAKQLMKSVGLRVDAPSANRSCNTTNTATSKVLNGTTILGRHEQLYVPPATLPILFAQRKKFLQNNKLKGTKQPYRLNEQLPVGLLSLPEDVLLKIVCYLRHNEIWPLFQACKQLNNTLKTAVHFHFNYATPYRTGEECGPPQPRPERIRKRAVTNLAAVLCHLTRSGRLTAEA